MDKKNWIIVGLLVACAYTYINQPAEQPRRPILNAVAKAIKWLPWVAPFFVLSEPVPEPSIDEAPNYEYGKVPEHTNNAPDGFAAIDHGDNW